ncbi:MAG: DNA-3-methyladenine glycosylase I, partial [Proteobacteria bacterium]|nr:DNA-3-methyladenine glycosylase I [Pseudomonadota bacterium]
MPRRCGWVPEDKVYMDYHDNEWGRPMYNDRQLFELLCLEGAQAGLSWLTILKRRDNYREAFDQFDPEIIAGYTDEKIEELVKNEKIIRNRLKIRSVVSNAKAYLEIEKREESFSSYIWSFVDHESIINRWPSLSDVPTQTELSREM